MTARTASTEHPHRPGVPSEPSPSVTYDDFAALEGHIFSAEIDPDGAAQLALVHCSTAQRQHGYVSYTLTFEGASDQPLGQGTFLLTAEGLAPTPVFLVPTARNGEGLRYEAVFNQEEA